MKKVFLIILLLMFASTAYAAQWMHSSGTKADDALIFTGAGNLYGFVMALDGAVNCTIDIYDGLSATGTQLIPQSIITTAATKRVVKFYFDPPIHFSKGCYVDIDPGLGTVGYVIYYSE